MERRTGFAVLAVAALAVAAVATVLIVFALGRDTTLTFSVRDSVSGRWVWEAAMKLQDRAMVGYYQSDVPSFTFRFSHLKPGAATLQIVADSYETVALPVTLRRGANRLEKPVSMVGVRIPDLKKFYLFEKIESGDIAAQLRPVSSTGTAVLNHPCLDLWIGAAVSVQMMNGSPAVDEAESGVGAARGKELYRGQIAWSWDPAPEHQFRYNARIPGGKITEDPSDYRVIDYLIVVPDPRAMGRAELDSLMARVYPLRDPRVIAAALDAEKARLSYFVDTTWNLKARPE
jgi:hypothetical protein